MTAAATAADADPRAVLYKPEEAARALRIGRTKLFALIASGEITSVQIGSLRRIPAKALDEYVERLSQPH